MNRKLYRIVFNRALGVFQVVAEIARRLRGGGAAHAAAMTARRPIALAIGLALAGAAQAQPADPGAITGDPQAPGAQRPTVLAAPNGVPLVDIASPSEAGVSRNRYRQFDVGSAGAILNNARQNVRTELGGWVQGNPQLARGTARVIVNEIDSGVPSRLHGYIEVGGDRAELVIANPAGIQADGSGFINASRATLTTGQLQFGADGGLAQYRVDRGRIQLQGRGLDASGTDYTDLIARGVQINAGLWARQLRVTAGANDVAAGSGATRARAPAGPAPGFALDVGALGGMYANKIHLVGTEAGLGVRNAGTIGAQGGGLVLHADGRLVNTGTLQSQAGASIDAHGGIANAGTISAADELQLQTARDLDNREGRIDAPRLQVQAATLANRAGRIAQTGAQALQLQVGELSNREGGRIGAAQALPAAAPGAAVAGTGGPAERPATPVPSPAPGEDATTPGPTPAPTQAPERAPGHLRIAGRLDNDGGAIEAARLGLETEAGGLDNAGGRLALDKLTLRQGELRNANGELRVAGATTLNLTRLDNTGGQLWFGTTLTLRAGAFINRGGRFAHAGAADMQLRVDGLFDNDAGRLDSNAATLLLDSGTLRNQRGTLTHAGAQTLDVRSGDIDALGGRIASNGAVRLSAGRVDHRGAQLEGRQFTVEAAVFDNRGGQVQASGTDASALHVAGWLDNGDGGRIVANGALALQTARFGNAGGAVEHAGGGTLALTAGTLSGAGGRLASLGMLRVRAGGVDLRGASTQAQDVDIEADALTTAGGRLSALGSGQARLRVRDALDNAGGTLEGNGQLWLAAGELDNQAGTIRFHSRDAHAVQVDRLLDNRGGDVLAAGALGVTAGVIDNRGGRVATFDATDPATGAASASQQSALTIATREDLHNANGKLIATGALAIETAGLDNTAGLIDAAGAMDLRMRGAVGNVDGTIQSAAHLRLDSAGLDNQRGRMLGATLAVEDAGRLDNRRGTIGTTTGPLQLRSGELDNSGGRLQSAADLAVDTRGQRLLNRASGQDGGLLAKGGIDLTSADLDNRGGAVLAGQSATLRAGALDNRDGGLVGSGTAMAMTAASLANAGGKVQSGGTGTLRIEGGIDNRGGLLTSNGLLELAARDIDNRDTRRADTALGLQAGSLRIAADGVDNASGLLVAATDATLALAGQMDNTQGVVSAGRTLGLRTAGLNNDAGLLHAGALQELDVTRLTGKGRIQSQGDAKLRVRGDLGHDGQMVANGQLQLTADGTLENRGTLRGGTGVQVRAGAIDNAASGEIDSQGLTQLLAETRIVNRGLVDGATSHLQAPRIDNLGGGRLYGNHVAIAATTLRNGAEVIDGIPRAGTIAARERLDLGVGTLDNRDQALIHSGGNAAVGGALDAARNATGAAEAFVNAGASVDISGDLVLAARRIENLRDVTLTEVTTREAPVRLDQPEWRPNRKNASEDIRNTSNYDAREVYYLRPEDILEDAPYVTPDGQPLRRAVIRLSAQTSAFLHERGGLHAALSLRGRLAPREGTVTIYYDGRRDNQDNPDQIAPGQQDPFAPLTTIYREPGAASAPAFRYLDEPIAWSGDYGTCRTGCVQLWAPYAYADPTRVLINPEGTGGGGLGDNEQYRVATRTTTEQRVASSGPDAVLQSGGNMRLVTGQLGNTYGRIVAGGNLGVEGIDGHPPVTTNIGATLTRTYTFERVSHAYNGSTRTWGAPAISEVIGQVGGVISSGGVLDLKGDRLDNLDRGRPAPNLVERVAPNLQPGPAAREAAAALATANVRAGALDAVPAPVPAADGSADRIAAGQLDARVPSASLYRAAPGSSGYLVETDPRFADGRQWLGSNYLLQQLGYDPSATLKRLGDGYYEQTLVREQVAQLTGRRFLQGYASDEEQLRALLDAGATYARQFGLRPGLALSAAQMAALTSDIVWLVEQTVALPDGSTTTALVPRLYVRLRPGDLKPTGAVLAGEAVKAELVGDLVNSGTIAGRQLVDLKGGNLRNLGGRIDGDGVRLEAASDIDNIGGRVTAKQQLVAVAGRNINQVSTTATQEVGDGRNSQRTTTLDRLAVMTVTAPGGTLLVSAGSNYDSRAGQLRNEGAGGQTAVVTGGDINLGTVNASEQADAVRDANNYRKSGGSRDVGSIISGDDAVTLRSGGDIHATASTVNSANGALTVLAEGDIKVGAGQATATLDRASRNSASRMLGSKTTSERASGEEAIALGSRFGGKQVVLQGRNIAIEGSNVLSDDGTVLVARDKVSLVAAENTDRSSYDKQVKRSGMFSGGNVGFSIGSQSLQQEGEQRSVTHTGSVVGSVDGKTTVHAGGDYLQQGSDVISGDGVAISGKTVAIEDVQDTFAYDERQKTRSGGIHVSLKGGAADAVNAAYANAQRAGQSDDNRLKALYAARGAQALYGNGSNPLGNIPGQVANSQGVVDNKQGANNGGLSLRIGVGGSSTDAQRRGSEATSVGSNVYSANGDVVVVAREGDLAITGSTVEGINTSVAAAQQLIVTSGRNIRQSRESNKGSSAEIGITIGSEAGIGIYASASGFRGKGAGDEATYTEARVGGSRGTTTFISGGDTVLEGAQFVGQRVIGQVGGDLIARSQQDSNQYHAKQVAAGIDAAIGTGGGSVSGYVSAGKVDSTYTSVREQTGIQAGEGGYQIDVTGKTVLDGAAIASTADPDRNFFRTGSLEWNDLVNQAKYKAVQASVSGGGGSGGGGGMSGSFQQKDDSASSITRAGVADGVLIVGDGSGQDIARGVTKLQQDGLKEIFDAQKVANQMELGQVAGQVAFNAAGTIAAKNGWAEGSKEKVALHAAVGAGVAALSGGNALDGLAGAAANQALFPAIKRALEVSGIREADNPAVFNALVQAASLAVGGATGGGTGAGVALSAEVNNRQLHPDEIAYLADKADEFAAQAYGCAPGTCSPQQVAAARDRLITEAAQRVDGVMATRIAADDKEAEGFINANPIKFGWGEGFTATREQYNDFRYFGELLSQDRQSLAAIAQALGTAGWTKKDFQEAYNPQLLTLANKARGDDGKAVLEMFSGDVGMGLGIIAKVINGDIKGAAADAALAALPWGVVKSLRPILPVADAGGGLIWVNGKKLDAKWLNAKGELTWVNPVTNAMEVVPDKAVLNADHILPRDAIKKIDGFSDLPKKIQNSLMEDPRNYQPMVQGPNCSKGCTVEGVSGGWKTVNGEPVHPGYKIELEKRQNIFHQIVENTIAQHKSTSK